MLLVVPSDAQLVALPADIKALYDDKNVYKYDMVLGHMYFGDGDVDDGAQRSFPEIWDLHGDQTVDPNAVITTAFPSFYVVNGQHEPSVEIAAGSVGLFRMVNAGAFKTLVLKFGTDNVCELRLIARDGVFQQGGYPRVTRIVLAPGSRADVAVKCTPPITAVYPFDLPLFADGNDNGPLDPINLHAQAVVFNLHIVDPASNQQWPLLGSFPRLSTVLPSYLTDLRTATPVWKRLIDMEDFKINGRYFPGYRAPSSQRYVVKLSDCYTLVMPACACP